MSFGWSGDIGENYAVFEPAHGAVAEVCAPAAPAMDCSSGELRLWHARVIVRHNDADCDADCRTEIPHFRRGPTIAKEIATASRLPAAT